MIIIINNGHNIFINLFNITIVIKSMLGKSNKLNSINARISFPYILSDISIMTDIYTNNLNYQKLKIETFEKIDNAA